MTVSRKIGYQSFEVSLNLSNKPGSTYKDIFKLFLGPACFAYSKNIDKGGWVKNK